MADFSKTRFETKQLHVGQEQEDSTSDSRAVPIYATTSYLFHNSKHAGDHVVAHNLKEVEKAIKKIQKFCIWKL